jgi:hypothetical protein
MGTMATTAITIMGIITTAMEEVTEDLDWR